MADKQYVVTGHMASFDTMTEQGPMRVTFYRGNRVPVDAKPEQITHHLSVGMIAEVPSDTPVGLDSAGAVVAGNERTGGDGNPGEPFLANDPQTSEPGGDTAAKTAEARSAAQAKLPEDGSLPDGRASKDVFVEWLARNGYEYDELVKQDKPDLVALAKQVAGQS